MQFIISTTRNTYNLAFLRCALISKSLKKMSLNFTSSWGLDKGIRDLIRITRGNMGILRHLNPGNIGSREQNMAYLAGLMHKQKAHKALEEVSIVFHGFPCMDPSRFCHVRKMIADYLHLKSLTICLSDDFSSEGITPEVIFEGVKRISKLRYLKLALQNCNKDTNRTIKILRSTVPKLMNLEVLHLEMQKCNNLTIDSLEIMEEMVNDIFHLKFLLLDLIPISWMKSPKYDRFQKILYEISVKKQFRYLVFPIEISIQFFSV